MHISAIKTHAITTQDTNILAVLDKYVPQLTEKTIIVVTSKIVSLCEGAVVPKSQATKEELIQENSQRFLPADTNSHHFHLTITRNTLIAAAGIDESNADGNYVLWPQDPQRSADLIRTHFAKRCKNIGVLITDSKTTPLRRGVTGMALSHSGFAALHNYVGTPDIFGRNFKVVKSNVADGLAAAAVTVMGEGNEQTPIAIITDVPFVIFTNSNPTAEELSELSIAPEDDIFGALIENAPWKRGDK